MKTMITVGALALALLAAPAAEAADLPRRGAPPVTPYAAPAPAGNWAGFYAGINLGYQWGMVTNSAFDPSGFALGGQVGYLWQMDRVVFGLEADLAWSWAEDVGGGARFTNDYFGTARARLGYAVDNLLVYGTGGFAYGNGELRVNGVGSQDRMLTGWVLGAGVEMMMDQNWSVRGEYLYIDLTDDTYRPTGLKHGLESSVIRFGVNYHF